MLREDTQTPSVAPEAGKVKEFAYGETQDAAPPSHWEKQRRSLLDVEQSMDDLEHTGVQGPAGMPTSYIYSENYLAMTAGDEATSDGANPKQYTLVKGKQVNLNYSTVQNFN